MKNLNLTIAQPCKENWNTFTPAEAGKFCPSCKTTVIDFTQMDDKKILAYYVANPTDNTCGRFKSSQLKIYYNPTALIRPGLKLFVAGLVTIVLLVCNQLSVAATPDVFLKSEVTVKTNKTGILYKDVIISGVVKSNDGELMPGVNIYLKNNSEGTVTDAEGKFEFPVNLKSGDILVFSFIGYEKVEYTVPANPVLPIEIIMNFETSIILGKIAVDEVYTEKNGFINKLFKKRNRNY